MDMIQRRLTLPSHWATVFQTLGHSIGSGVTLGEPTQGPNFFLLLWLSWEDIVGAVLGSRACRIMRKTEQRGEVPNSLVGVSGTSHS